MSRSSQTAVFLGGSFRSELRLVARAWEGDGESIAKLAEADADGVIAQRHRAGPALCRVAVRAGVDPSEVWTKSRLATAGRQMLLVDSLHRVGKTLAAASIPWTPIKGLDLLTRRPAVYDPPEDRPTTDLDLLIPEGRLDDARRALLEFGARDLTPGRRAERYLRDEGYAWQAALPSSVLLEIHFRLWAQAHPELPAALLDAAMPTDDLPGALRLQPAHAYLLAAVHAFTVETPRGTGIWRDLAALAGAHPDLADRVADDAERFDVQLPVALAARLSAELFQSRPCAEIAERLRRGLRGPERRLRDASAAELPLSTLALARHLAGRNCRRGLLRAAWRWVWPHAGVVEAATPESWWPLRRLRFQWQRSPLRTQSRSAQPRR